MDASTLTLTSSRASRLCRLLTFLSSGPQSRAFLIRRLRLDIRGFYRDLEALRALGIAITTVGDNAKYMLVGDVDDALAKLPFPDPGLNVRDALLLCNGNTAAHRRLKQRVNSFLSGLRGSPRSNFPNKPR